MDEAVDNGWQGLIIAADLFLLFKVLHHVNSTGIGNDYPIIEELFRRTKRILRPKGLMIIVTALHSGKDVVWYTKLHQGLTERYMKFFPAMEQYLRMFIESGFECLT